MATIQDIFDWLNQGAQGDIPGTGGSQPNTGAASQGVQTAGDVLGWRGQEGDQSSVPNAGAPGGPMGPWMRGQGMDPAMKGYDWGGVPTQRPWLMSPQTPANEASAESSAQEAAEKGAQAGQKAGQGLWAMLFGKQPQKTPGDYSGDIPATSLMHYQALISQGIPPAVAHSILTQPSQGEGEKPIGPNPWASYSGWEQESQAAHGPQSDAALSQHMWDVRRTQQENLPTWEQNTPGDDDNLGFQRLPTGQYVPYPSQGLDYWAAQGNPQSFYWNPQPGSSWLNDLLGSQ